MHLIKSEIKIKDPNIDDSIKPDFKVFWVKESSGERGHSTFFSYEYGIEIVEAVFYSMYPDRKISQIQFL